MSRHLRENILAGVLLLFFIGILWMSYGYGERARMIPVPISILGILLTLGQIFWQNTRSEADLHVDLLQVLTNKKGGSPETAPPPEPERTEGGSVFGALGIVGGLLGLFLVVGPFFALFLFVAGYLLGSRYGGVLLSVSLAAAVTIVLYLIFVVGLQLQVYHGVLEPVARAVGL